MTKRERVAISHKIAKLMTKLGGKRDEVRNLASDAEALIESVKQAEDQFDDAIASLERAQRSIEDAGDSLSQYV